MGGKSMLKIEITEKAKEKLEAILEKNAGKKIRLMLQGFG